MPDTVDPSNALARRTLHGPRFGVDDGLRIVDWPVETARRTGIDAEEVLGLYCWQVIHPGSGPEPPPCLSGCLALRRPLHRVAPPRGEGDDPCAAMPLPESKGGAIVWMPERAEPVAVDPMERLVVKGAMADRLGDVDETLDFLRRYSGADDSELFLLDDEAREVFHTASAGPDAEAFLELTHIPLGAGYPGGVTLTQRPMLTNDFQNDRVFLRSSVRECGLRSFLGVPLSRHGEPLGYLGLGWRDARAPLTSVIARLDGLKALLVAGLPHPAEHRFAVPIAPIEIRCFGGFEIRVRGELLRARAFVRRKALTLLKLLILHAPQPIHRDWLIETLWPDADPHRGANRLHGVVHALRQTLSGALMQAGDLIGHDEDAYFFNASASVRVDLLDYEAALERARQSGSSAALSQAVALYTGELFADELYGDWATARRSLARERYLDAVRALTTREAAKARWDSVVSTLKRALSLEPFAEDLHQKLIQALVVLGRRTEAREQYERCLELIRSGGMDPLPETVALGRTLSRAGNRGIDTRSAAPMRIRGNDDGQTNDEQ